MDATIEGNETIAVESVGQSCRELHEVSGEDLTMVLYLLRDRKRNQGMGLVMIFIGLLASSYILLQMHWTIYSPPCMNGPPAVPS
jgi:hypothetical protein